MADESYWVCFLTDPLGPDIEKQIRTRAETVGFAPDDSADGELKLRTDDGMLVSITRNRGEQWAWNEPRLLLSFWTKPLRSRDDAQRSPSPAQVQRRVDRILALVIELSTLTDPTYAWSMLNAGPQPDAGLRPADRPIADHVSGLSWVTVFSQSVVADLGGRARVLRTPAWRTEALDSGHIVIVTTDNPVDPTAEPDTEPEVFLFGSDDADG